MVTFLPLYPPINLCYTQTSFFAVGYCSDYAKQIKATVKWQIEKKLNAYKRRFLCSTVRLLHVKYSNA